MISILIPCYNRSQVIEQTIQSAINQTRHDIEIIVVDNCSTDDTWNIISMLAKQDPRIRAFQNETNVGPIKNWQRCITEANGDYAKILWSDDLMAPNFLEKTVPILEANSDVGFVYTQYAEFSESIDTLFRTTQFGPSGIYEVRHYIQAVFSNGNFPYSPGNALFRLRDLKNSLTVYIPNQAKRDSSQHGIGPDLLFYLITCTRYPFYAQVDEVLSFFRSHPNSISIVAGEKKLTHHYNIAKAFFAYTYRKELIPRLNSQIHLALLSDSKSSQWGLNSISDFYPTPLIKHKFDWKFLASRILKKILRPFYK